MPDRGAHDRFPAAASVAAREGFLDDPARRRLRRAAVERAGGGLAAAAAPAARLRGARSPTTSTTRWRRSAAGRALIARQFAGDVVLRKDPPAGRAPGALARRRAARRPAPRPPQHLRLPDGRQRAQRAAQRVLLPRQHPGRRAAGAYYLVDHPWVRRLIGHVHRRGHEVGLHAGFGTYRDPGRTAEQFARLRAVADAEGVVQERWGGRQHYLQWANPVTWRNWSEAGLDYDCTLAYAEAVGFRTGTCHAYRVFDLEHRRALDLQERPFQVMDVTLFGYLGLSRERRARRSPTSPASAGASRGAWASCGTTTRCCGRLAEQRFYALDGRRPRPDQRSRACSRLRRGRPVPQGVEADVRDVVEAAEAAGELAEQLRVLEGLELVVARAPRRRPEAAPARGSRAPSGPTGRRRRPPPA